MPNQIVNSASEESKEFEDNSLLESMNSSRLALHEKSKVKAKNKHKTPFDEEEEEKEAGLFSQGSDQQIEEADKKNDIKFFNDPGHTLHSQKDLLGLFYLYNF